MAPVDPTAPSAIFQSDLAQKSLPDILATVHRYKVPGRIECRREDELKRVYVEDGSIIFATTNRVSESLGDLLLRDGRITREQYDASVRRIGETGKRHGAILVEMGAITGPELPEAVRKQIQEIVWSVFSWTAGDVTFTPGREKHLEFVKVSIPIPQAIVHGARCIPDARVLVERMGTKTTALRRSAVSIPELRLEADEKHVLEMVNGRRTLFELVNTPGLPAPDNARILYGLFVLQLIEVAPIRQIKVQVKSGGDHEA